MNIYRQELKMLRGSFAAWIISLLALASIYLSVYPAFSHDVQAMTDLFARMADTYKYVFAAGGFEIFTFLGFIANVLSILLLAGAVQAMNMGIALANRERLAQTTDFLLAKPVGRSRIFAQKLLAHLTVLAVTSIVLISFIYIGGHVAGAGDFSLRAYLMIMGVFTGIQLWFLAAGIAVSAVAGRIRSVVAVSLATVFGMFVLGMFGTAVGDDVLRFITPFKYVDLVEVVKSQTYESIYLVVGALVFAACIAVGWRIYVRKDVHA